MATGGKSSSGRDRSAQETRERARLYQARTEFHEAGKRRRRRDNIIAGTVAGLLIAGFIGGQVVYYTVGPGAPAPAPTESPAPSLSPTPEVTSTESPSPAPTDTP